jgi:hypothetical protein
MSNPYESPQFAAPVIEAESGDREKARRVARYQQWVIYCLLANLVLNFVALAGQREPVAALVILGLLAVVVLLSMYSIFRLANEVYSSTGVGIACAVLMLVPCISLITLLVVNGKATTFLQQRGIKVGFMGVNPNTI